MSEETQTDPFAAFEAGPNAYAAMTKAEIKDSMDARYDTGNAYPNDALWIHVHHKELEDTFAEFLEGRAQGKSVLEVGCGSGGVAAHRLRDASLIVGTDLSDSALQIARDFFRADEWISFVQMDAEHLDFPDGSFDIVVAKEVLEHLPNAELCIANVHRLLKEDGLFALSSPNRDSFHLRLNRKLGGVDFPCSGDHIREYTYDEMTELLTANGFTVIGAEGVTLTPYHYVEGVFPDPVKALEDSDREFNEWLRVLGRRAGPEFAFCYVILAAKAPNEPANVAQTQTENSHL